MVRQERIGLHMADAISRVTSGRKIGVFCMQHGPGTENAYGGVAQAYGEIGADPGRCRWAMPRRIAHIAAELQLDHRNARHHQIAPSRSSLAAEVPNILRRAFTRLRNGRGGPVLVEIPTDMWNEELPEPLDYVPVFADALRPRPGRGEARRRRCWPRPSAR